MNTNLITETSQYLTFKLDGEIFAVDVAQVREILDVIKITKVPKTPDYMCGVINLRGNVVSVIDMRLKFNMPSTEKTVNTCIVVLEVEVDNEITVIGALVDSVQEVFELEPSDIEPAPKIGLRLKTEFIEGMGKKDDNFIIILNIDEVFESEELALVNSLNKSEELIK